MVPCHTAFSRIYGLVTLFFYDSSILSSIGISSLGNKGASELVALFAVCFCIRIIGITILGALHIGTGVGLRSLVVALPEDIFVTMST